MFKQLLYWACVAAVNVSYAATTTVTGNSGYTSNCIPFGSGAPSNYGTYTGFVYQNVPAFSLGIGDTIAFDLAALNDTDITMDIALAATTSNGSVQEDSNGFTQIVQSGTAAIPRGNSVAGDYELEFTLDAPFTFAGGGLIIRFKAGGAFASDTSCDQVLHGFDSSDSSGYFVSRFYGEEDGGYPWAGSDGSSNGGFVLNSSDIDGDGFSASTDCDDNDSSIYPGAPEYCDGVDTDCDNTLDEDDALDAVTWYADTDGDGYGDANTTNVTCYIASGWLADSSDCDDTSSATYPGAPEYCDGVDTDCDSTVDEDDAIDASTWYADSDGDGYGDANTTSVTCYIASGWRADSSDCDDTSSATYPGAPEYCDGVDTDCDNIIDEDDALDVLTWYADADEDGEGDANVYDIDCYQPDGFVFNSEDCDDLDATINVYASEIWYDGVDQNCDTWSDYDQDGDGFDSANDPNLDGDVGDDCDDEDFDINIDATELWYDGIDQDCDYWSDFDQDGDGFDSESYGGDDCDDSDAEIYPGAPDTPYDDIITDCDNASDYDADGDGFDSIDYGGDDCDDANSEINIDMEEIWYDGVDQDCDGNDDDQDEDGFPADEDCDDLDPDSYPGNGLLDLDCSEIDLGDTGDTGLDEEAKGCGCSGSSTGSGPIWLLSLVGMMLYRRRKAR